MTEARARPLVLFDGDCGFCRRHVERWKHLTGDRVDYAPVQEAGSWLPGVDHAELLQAIHLVETDGKIYRGAEAVFRALSRAPTRRPLLWAYRGLPGFRLVSEAVYRHVAGHRSGFSRVDRWVHGEAGPPSHFLTRFVFLRGLGSVYLIAFASLWPQIGGLVGPRGILPAEGLLESAHQAMGASAYHAFPTLMWLRPAGETPEILCAAGAAISLLLLLGVAVGPSLILLWVLYLSVSTIGQDFLNFQWDALLLEVGFAAILWSPLQIRRGPGLSSPAPLSVVWLTRWILFRLMFMSGVVKLLSGDEAWSGLTALSFHYETQPIPNPLSWYVHHLPAAFHMATTLLTFVAELAIPFLIFAPRRLRLVPFVAFAGLQVMIALTGNYGYFSLLSLVLGIALLDDAFLARWLPRRLSWRLSMGRPTPTLLRRLPAALVAVLLVVASLVLMAGRFFGYGAVPALTRSAIAWIEPFNCVNNYGLFAIMTKSRPEIVIEGSMDGQEWKAYEFRWKPGDLERMPPQVAPYMPRLDWQMWFAALGSQRQTRWFTPLLGRLLEGSPEVMGLLETAPFAGAAPRYVRAVLYDYRFTPRDTEGPAWWRREMLGLYAPPIGLAPTDRQAEGAGRPEHPGGAP